MLETASGTNNIFRQIEHIQISDIHYQAHGYFGLTGNGNVGNDVLTNPLIVLYLLNLATSAQELQNLYDRVLSDMIAKEIEGPITKEFIKKIRLHRGEYECTDSGGIMMSDGTTMIQLIFKSIKPATRIDVSNFKD